MSSCIEINHITKDYGKGRGVFDVSFHVQKGEVLGFLGPNGAGKTTTIRQLMGFIKPDSGTVSILGMDCFHDADRIHRHLGYLPGEIAFVDSMNGMEFIRFVAKINKMTGLGRAEELMKRFDLNPAGKLKKMSKGMKQKIGIVCAFMEDSDILILDEPTSGLDPLMQNAFIDLILEEKERGKTILMSSHMFEEVERTCDRAAIIRNGKLAAVEDIEKLKSGRQKIVELHFEDYEMAEAFAKRNKHAAQDQCKVTVHTDKENNIDRIIKQAGWYTVQDIDTRTQSLEEFFLHFYGEEESDK